MAHESEPSLVSFFIIRPRCGIDDSVRISKKHKIEFFAVFSTSICYAVNGYPVDALHTNELGNNLAGKIVDVCRISTIDRRFDCVSEVMEKHEGESLFARRFTKEARYIWQFG